MHSSEIERENTLSESPALLPYTVPQVEVQELRLVTNGGISGFGDSGSTEAQFPP